MVWQSVEKSYVWINKIFEMKRELKLFRSSYSVFF